MGSGLFASLFASLSPALARLILGHIALHASMAALRMSAPLWALKNGHSAAAVGVLGALFALTQVFLALSAGRYADRVGLKKPVAIAVVIAVVGSAAATAYPHFLVLCFAALCLGGATGTAVIALQRHVGRAASGPTELKQVFSWLSIGPAASNFVGPFLAGLLIDFVSFRAAFALCIILPLLTWWATRTAQETVRETPADDKPRRAWDLLQNRDLRRMLIVNWLLSSCWDVHTFVVPILGHERGISASVIGTILGVFAIAGATVRILLPVIAHAVREWAVIVMAMVVTCALLAVYPLMPTALSMGVVSVFMGFALGSVQPMVMSLLHQMTPEHRHGEVLGLRMMVVNASSVAMPLFFGFAGALVGSAALFWIASAMVGLGARTATQLKKLGS
jgi:predicted MFS family arabinose efflux permease